MKIFNRISNIFKSPNDSFDTEVKHIFNDIMRSIDGLQDENKQLKNELMSLEPYFNTNEYLQSFVNALSDVTDFLIWGKNNDGTIIIMNDNMKFALQEFTGIEGKSVEEIVEIHEAKYGDSTLREIFMEDNDNDIPSTSTTTCRCTLKGSEKIFRIRKSIMRNFMGERIGICGAIDDITTRVHKLEEIHNLTRSEAIKNTLDDLKSLIFNGTCPLDTVGK